jgi:hypothetical protein
VTWRNLKQDILDAAKGEYKAFTAPFFSKILLQVKKECLGRQCTGDYKIKPVIQKIRRTYRFKKR